jgi:mitochondrial fission protein ELM1
LHRATPDRLAAASARLAPRLAALPRPLVAVLIGGASRAYPMTPAVLGRLAADLVALARDHGASLLVTASRRTGADCEAALRAALEGVVAEFWDGSGENPYLGYLGLADAVVVTGDSVTMISEAAATGRPVHVVELPGGTAKFRRFHEAMRAAGITRPFSGRLEAWRYPPLDETARIAAEIRRRHGVGAAGRKPTGP